MGLGYFGQYLILAGVELSLFELNQTIIKNGVKLKKLVGVYLYNSTITNYQNCSDDITKRSELFSSFWLKCSYFFIEIYFFVLSVFFYYFTLSIHCFCCFICILPLFYTFYSLILFFSRWFLNLLILIFNHFYFSCAKVVNGSSALCASTLPLSDHNYCKTCQAQ